MCDRGGRGSDPHNIFGHPESKTNFGTVWQVNWRGQGEFRNGSIEKVICPSNIGGRNPVHYFSDTFFAEHDIFMSFFQRPGVDIGSDRSETEMKSGSEISVLHFS